VLLGFMGRRVAGGLGLEAAADQGLAFFNVRGCGLRAAKRAIRSAG
jgi:hypothetical protein